MYQMVQLGPIQSQQVNFNEFGYVQVNIRPLLHVRNNMDFHKQYNILHKNWWKMKCCHVCDEVRFAGCYMSNRGLREGTEHKH